MKFFLKICYYQVETHFLYIRRRVIPRGKPWGFLHSIRLFWQKLEVVSSVRDIPQLPCGHFEYARLAENVNRKYSMSSRSLIIKTRRQAGRQAQAVLGGWNRNGGDYSHRLMQSSKNYKHLNSHSISRI